MLFFRRKKVEVVQELDKFNQALELSFGHVKTDVRNIYSWLKFLYQQNIGQQKRIELVFASLNKLMALRDELKDFTREEIRVLVDKHYSLEPLNSRIREIEEKINLLTQKYETARLTVGKPQLEPQIQNTQANPYLARALRPGSTFLKERILRKVARDSKDYVKNFIHSLISKYGRIAALQLREIVVEDQGLCSKSSFYRILAELEKGDDINVIQDGKGKLFISNLANSKNLNNT